jgi:glycosyltransferase involved in cell wall biosynthesis
MLSVILPAHQEGAVLRRALAALEASDLPRACWELIVVDDASTDDTSAIAAEFADVLVRLGGTPRGPAYARNRGFEVARGATLVFIDADVCVHPDALRRFAAVFVEEPDVSAVFGSYDAEPPTEGFVSQYRNLLHHCTHQRNAGDADTFWSGCGAIRRTVFAEAGMYDEWHFRRPPVEDFELGQRLRERQHRILLRPEIQATHLKSWTLRGMVTADLHDVAMPCMRLTDAAGTTAGMGRYRLDSVEHLGVAISWLAVIGLLGAFWLRHAILLMVPAVCLAQLLWLNGPTYRFFVRHRGPLFALGAIPMHLLHHLVYGLGVVCGWLLHEIVGEPSPEPTVQAFAEVGVKTWPPVPVKRSRGG